MVSFILGWLEHIVFVMVLAALIRVWMRHGAWGVAKTLVVGLKQLPGVESLVELILEGEAKKFVRQNVQPVGDNSGARTTRVVLPKDGTPADELLKQMKTLQEAEVDHSQGLIFAYTYSLENEQLDMQRGIWDLWQDKCPVSGDHEKLSREFFNAFLHENAINPMIYPALRQMETEIISMTADMLHGDEHVVGFHTSGGTESILMAVKTYRDRARKLFPHITKPNIVVPNTIHPCMMKACHYFNVEIIRAPVLSNYRADVDAMERLITPNTIMLAASAPQFPHGLVDPIEDISDMALRRGIPLHIDSCFGGFMLPWVEKLGYPVPKFDFRCPGVTSISADAHKWGYCSKGSSVVLYRNDSYRKHQIFSYAGWCGGLYGSPSMAGTRPAGNIASTWATMRYLGESGYKKMAQELMTTTRKLQDAVRDIPGLGVVGEPQMNCFAIYSTDPDLSLLAVADVMEKSGYKMERQTDPDCVHLSILPHHIATVDKVAAAFRHAAAEVKKNKSLAKEGTAGIYGMMAAIPDKAIVSDFVVEFFSQVYR